jgi:hypothetical protein
MSFLASALLRPRGEVRRRLDAWGKTAIERLRAIGAETYASVKSRPGPHQDDPLTGDGDMQGHRVVLIARGTKADRARAQLVLSCDAERIEVGLEVQPSGFGTLRTLLADPERAVELLDALDALPDQFAIGFHESRAAWARGSTDEVRGALGRADSAARPLWLGWSVPRELAMAHADSLDEQMQDALVALGPVFALLDVNARTRADAKSRRSRARAPRREHRDGAGVDDERVAKPRSRAHDARHELERDAVEPEPEPEADREAATRAVRGSRAALTGQAGRRGALSPRIDPRAPVDRGTLVRVLDGPFSGKVGVVQELDGKGGARVLLGLLAVRVAVKDVAACSKGRERPLLSSSHRKLPARYAGAGPRKP